MTGAAITGYTPWQHSLPAFTASGGAFREGRSSPREYLEQCIARIERLEPQVRAFVHLDLPAARRAADEAARRWREGSPLSDIDGMPVGVKDIIETREMPTQMNSPIFAGFQPRRDAACVLALKRAGVVVVGKTVTTEFAAGRPGPTRNPYDLARTPGGSSSGSAAGVAAGMLPAALGTQTQASIIRPASYCGVFGWKPSLGALPLEGVAPLSRTLDHLGVLAQHPEDAWAVARVLALPGTAQRDAAPPPRLPRRLIAVRTAGWEEAGEPSRQALQDALDTLRARGVVVATDQEPGVADLERMLARAAEDALSVFAWESQWPLLAYRDCGSDMVGERIQALVSQAARMTQDDYDAALRRRAELVEAVQALARTADAFVTLASSGPAPTGLENTGSRLFPAAWTLVGGPSCSLPALSEHGLPLGLQLMGAPGGDAVLFAAARAMEPTSHSREQT